jgi:mRNA interferase RelE/StbE
VYRVRILDAAKRELARLDKPLARRIIERITWLATNLDTISPEALTGELAGLCKLRVGDYRVIYEILHTEQTLVIHVVGHRREIYRRR